MGRYLLTGASGFIGATLAREICKKDNHLTVIVRNEKRLDPQIAECADIICADLRNEDSLSGIEGNFDYIIHCAAVTASSEMVTHPVEVADGIVLGTRNMLELARRCHVKSMVYLSSMEVYGTVTDIGSPRGEEELGDIDLNSPRSCYPMAKRMAEHYCHIYQKEYGVPVKIARLAQTFGTGVRQDDNRVFMQFARAAVQGKDIVLKTTGNSVGNYCDTMDAIDAILLILEKGIGGEVYNVVNEKNTMSIRAMAELVADRLSEGRTKVQICPEERSVTGYAPDTALRLSSQKLRDLGWTPTKEMVDMYQDVIDSLKMKG